jgi:hypothetical protein
MPRTFWEIAGRVANQTRDFWIETMRREQVKTLNGKCDRCDEYGMIWLDGAGIFCWQHYCDEMKARRR